MRFTAPTLALAGILLASSACNPGTDPTSPGTTSLQDNTAPAGAVPLIDLLGGQYLGFPGGLYPGSNTVPASHDSRARTAAAQVVPLDRNGRPNSQGAIVLLSVGMSNTSQEWCTQSGTDGVTCSPWTFAGRASRDGQRQPKLRVFNGAMGGATAGTWVSPSDRNYTRVNGLLQHQGLSPSQVQAVWINEADPSPRFPLPAKNADARTLEGELGRIVRTLQVRYPHLREIFLSSRIYGGYATIPLNPEPFAYEAGFAVKWLIEAQINQERTGRIDPVAGDLSARVAPVLLWGPYLWAAGTHPRSDGLVWNRSDFETDGTHPSQNGESKVGSALLGFFHASPYACWYLRSGNCSSGGSPIAAEWNNP